MMMARPKAKRPVKDIRRAVELYICGSKMQDIADMFNVTQPTVTYWVKKHGKSMFGKTYEKSVRSQGRRTDEVPNERDKNLIYKAAAGVPVTAQAKELGISRARASYIVKTWIDRGYTPPIFCVPGQVITDGNNRYTVIEPGWQKGKVVQTHDQSGKIEPVEIENFKWYRNGALCEVVQ